jgi:hypothetical protein
MWALPHQRYFAKLFKSVVDNDELSGRLIFPALTTDVLALKAQLPH